VPVRPVRADDFKAVCALLDELGRPAVSRDTQDVCRTSFMADLADPAADHLIAVDDHDKPVGFCSLHYRRRLNQATEEAWIPDLIVAERVRSSGIGGALLAEAERRARERGCHQLVLESAYFRKRAHSFYLAAGMTDAAKAFAKKLT
jgi:GNAT superfamily N-acetyltransferase